MDYFEWQGEALHAEAVPLSDIARDVGTPTFVYSDKTIVRHFNAYASALAGLPHTICYAVKANSNLTLLKRLADLGAGFDIVSQGELERVYHATGDVKRVVFSGVGKTETELMRALRLGIHCFNIETPGEIETLNRLAAHLNNQAPIAIRLNPNIDAQTHPYIATGLKDNKFGLDTSAAQALYHAAKSHQHINIIGLDCHLGSQICTLPPYGEAADLLLTFAQSLADEGIHLHHINMGGGLGVPYQDEQPPLPDALGTLIKDKFKNTPYHVLLEPGRSIMANAGILLTRCIAFKSTDNKVFAIVDAGMNDLIRPALYQAQHQIVPTHKGLHTTQTYDVVGPVCESADSFGTLTCPALSVGDLLAIRSAGAYGFCMSSQYNSRPRAAEVLVREQHTHIIRQRETFADLWRNEEVTLK